MAEVALMHRPSPEWQLDMGAQAAPGGVRFRVWAPNAQQVEVEVRHQAGVEYRLLAPEGEDGVFSGFVPGLHVGSLYRYRLDGGECFPDPYSRSQPNGVHGPSEVVDPSFPWQDADWRGIDLQGMVIYEVNVGTYTTEGSFEALIGQLPELKALGVTVVELMPVAEFPGRWNWGYDGVYLYAPARSYGGVAGLKRLVDAAHAHEMAVLLDVVFSHLGPNGNYLRAFAREYFTERYQTPWGDALDFDGPGSRWVRHFAIQNACYWLNEYHVDGLRLDATHAIQDHSPIHVLREMAETARASVPPGRSVVIIAEDSRNDVRLVRPVAEGGFGLDAVWADDFHHALHTYLTAEFDGYYEDYSGRLADVARTIKNGFLYQGEWSRHLQRYRGTPVVDEPARRFVFCLQNHDQVGNRAFGERLNHLVDAHSYAVASVVLLLAPETPLIFMGQEFAASAPFQFFTDHDQELGKLITAGRREEFKRFRAFRDEAIRQLIPDPQAEETFWRSHLDLSERTAHAGIYRLYHDLISMRRNDPVFSRQDRQCLQAMAHREAILTLHSWTQTEQRLVLANFRDRAEVSLRDFLSPAAPWNAKWRVLLSTSSPDYGLGEEQEAVQEVDDRLILPRTSAVVLASGTASLPLR